MWILEHQNFYIRGKKRVQFLPPLHLNQMDFWLHKAAESVRVNTDWNTGAAPAARIFIIRKMTQLQAQNNLIRKRSMQCVGLIINAKTDGDLKSDREGNINVHSLYWGGKNIWMIFFLFKKCGNLKRPGASRNLSSHSPSTCCPWLMMVIKCLAQGQSSSTACDGRPWFTVMLRYSPTTKHLHCCSFPFKSSRILQQTHTHNHSQSDTVKCD